MHEAYETTSDLFYTSAERRGQLAGVVTAIHDPDKPHRVRPVAM
jgi:hypothetical protein